MKIIIIIMNVSINKPFILCKTTAWYNQKTRYYKHYLYGEILYFKTNIFVVGIGTYVYNS